VGSSAVVAHPVANLIGMNVPHLLFPSVVVSAISHSAEAPRPVGITARPEYIKTTPF